MVGKGVSFSSRMAFPNGTKGAERTRTKVDGPKIRLIETRTKLTSTSTKLAWTKLSKVGLTRVGINLVVVK